jgi:hypothetical protein
MPKGLVVQLEHGNGGENLQTCFACLLSGVCVCVLAISDRCQRTVPLLIRG